MKKLSFILRKLLLFLLVIFILSVVNAEEKTAEVNKLFAQWDSTTSPGAALAIIKDEQLIYKRGYGMADLEHNIPITPTSVFRIASCSKQFTAACICILALEGKISFDDDIRRYIPELPEYEKPVTVRHLIHHTSGIRDYLTLEFNIAFKHDDTFFTPEDSVELIARQKKLNFLPGEKYNYSNSGYFLMGVIVNRVSGKSLNDFAKKQIFEPLGMKNTHFHDDHKMIVKNRAYGYSPAEKDYRIDMTTLDHVGDGGVFTTVEDLFLWDQAFYNETLGKDLIELLQTQGALNSGKKIDYAFGLRIVDYRGLRTVRHSGSYAGFKSAMIRFPEQKFSVICLANLSTINPTKLCQKIADIYLVDEFKEEPQKKKKIISLPKEELEKLTGHYQDEKSGAWAIISVKEDKLNLETLDENIVLMPVSKTRFIAVNEFSETVIDFLPETGEKEGKATMSLNGDEIYLVKVPKISPLSPSQLNEYAGEYYNEEIPVTYKLEVKGENLFLKGKNAPQDPLQLIFQDNFILKRDWTKLNFLFIRDENKKIRGIKVKSGRVLTIDFVKMET